MLGLSEELVEYFILILTQFVINRCLDFLQEHLTGEIDVIDGIGLSDGVICPNGRQNRSLWRLWFEPRLVVQFDRCGLSLRRYLRFGSCFYLGAYYRVRLLWWLHFGLHHHFRKRRRELLDALLLDLDLFGRLLLLRCRLDFLFGRLRRLRLVLFDLIPGLFLRRWARFPLNDFDGLLRLFGLADQVGCALFRGNWLDARFLFGCFWRRFDFLWRRLFRRFLFDDRWWRSYLFDFGRRLLLLWWRLLGRRSGLRFWLLGLWSCLWSWRRLGLDGWFRDFENNWCLRRLW